MKLKLEDNRNLKDWVSLYLEIGDLFHVEVVYDDYMIWLFETIGESTDLSVQEGTFMYFGIAFEHVEYATFLYLKLLHEGMFYYLRVSDYSMAGYKFAITKTNQR